MRIIHDSLEMKKAIKTVSENTIGFVPTMGALHAGHVSLIKRSLQENELTVVSIYLNPTQFNNQADLANYPVSWEDDCKILKELGVDFLFAPSYDTIYPDEYTYKIVESDISNKLCGAARPGHFDGVLTVVMKFLNIVSPDKAYFGEKDFQQLELIRGMVGAFFMDVEIIGCPLIREDDGLAMSSRNRRLSSAARQLAPRLYETLISSDLCTVPGKRQALEQDGFTVDYLEVINDRLYAAVFLDDIRLIDNVPYQKEKI